MTTPATTNPGPPPFTPAQQQAAFDNALNQAAPAPAPAPAQTPRWRAALANALNQAAPGLLQTPGTVPVPAAVPVPLPPAAPPQAPAAPPQAPVFLTMDQVALLLQGLQAQRASTVPIPREAQSGRSGSLWAMDWHGSISQGKEAQKFRLFQRIQLCGRDQVTCSPVRCGEDLHCRNH